jgi:chromosome segregation ATPase
MTGDVRLFDYPLDPSLQRLRWRLDEQLAELARALADVEPLRTRRDALVAEAAAVARESAQAQARRMDLALARHALDYLAGLHRQLVAAERQLHEAERAVVERRDAVAATQADIDKLERDRQECLVAHLREVERRAQREIDQDWTARSEWRARQASAREVLP